MPNFQSSINRIGTALMGSAVAMPMAQETYMNKMVHKATEYRATVKDKELIWKTQAEAVNDELSKFGKYIPAGYKPKFESAISGLRPVSLQEKREIAEAEKQAEWQAEEESKMDQANSIQNRQAAIEKSKGTKILGRDTLNQIYAAYVQEMMQKEDDKDGE